MHDLILHFNLILAELHFTCIVQNLVAEHRYTESLINTLDVKEFV
jgi:hypothetical protein